MSSINNQKYRASLDEAWAQFKAPREQDAPTVISTFTGGGGSSLGGHQRKVAQVGTTGNPGNEHSGHRTQGSRINIARLYAGGHISLLKWHGKNADSHEGSTPVGLVGFIWPVGYSKKLHRTKTDVNSVASCAIPR